MIVRLNVIVQRLRVLRKQDHGFGQTSIFLLVFLLSTVLRISPFQYPMILLPLFDVFLRDGHLTLSQFSHLEINLFPEQLNMLSHIPKRVHQDSLEISPSRNYRSSF